MPLRFDAAQLRRLDRDVAAAARRSSPAAPPDPARAFGAPQTICSGSPCPASTWQTCSLSASGCFAHSTMSRDDDAVERSSPSTVTSFDLEADRGQRRARVRRASAVVCRRVWRSQFSENFMRSIPSRELRAGNARRSRRTRAGRRRRSAASRSARRPGRRRSRCSAPDRCRTLRSTFGCTMPQPEHFQPARACRPRCCQAMSTSRRGSVNGK